MQRTRGFEDWSWTAWCGPTIFPIRLKSSYQFVLIYLAVLNFYIHIILVIYTKWVNSFALVMFRALAHVP